MQWLKEVSRRKDLIQKYDASFPEFSFTTSKNRKLTFYDLRQKDIADRICRISDWKTRCGTLIKKNRTKIVQEYDGKITEETQKSDTWTAVRQKLILEAGLPAKEQLLSDLDTELVQLKKKKAENWEEKQKEVISLRKEIYQSYQEISSIVLKMMKEAVSKTEKMAAEKQCLETCSKLRSRMRTTCEEIFGCKIFQSYQPPIENIVLPGSPMIPEIELGELGREKKSVNSKTFQRVLITSYLDSVSILFFGFKPKSTIDAFCLNSKNPSQDVSQLIRRSVSDERRAEIISSLNEEAENILDDESDPGNKDRIKTKLAFYSFIQELEIHKDLLIIDGMKSGTLNGEMEIFPNPSNGQNLKMKLTAHHVIKESVITVSVYNSASQWVASQKISLSLQDSDQEKEISLDFAKLGTRASGVYFLKVEGGSFPSKKIVIIK